MPTSGKSLFLFPGNTTSSPAAKKKPPRLSPAETHEHSWAHPLIACEELWLCIRLSRLPLESLPTPAGDGQPLAVIEEQGSSRVVVVCDEQAVARGIKSGLSVGAALALAPDLELLERDGAAELRTLTRLADWSLRFTSRSSIEAPDALLLEIQGSLRLFKGLDALRDRLQGGLARLALTAQLATAPTPLAALWLARADQCIDIETAGALAGSLSKLPLSVLCWPAKVIKPLRNSGIHTLGECLRLPRDGFARRIGAGRLAELDRGLGRRRDLRLAHQSSYRFQTHLELPASTANTDLLMQGIEKILHSLTRYLRLRQGGIQNLHFVFLHVDHPVTRMDLALVDPSRDPGRFLELASQRLERMRIPSPVIALSVHSDEVCALGEKVSGLFPSEHKPDTSEVSRLVERLRGRLGVDAVHGLCLVAEHRPEAAWKAVKPGTPAGMQISKYRPLWMLSRPVELDHPQKQPCYEGELSIESGPERIETGWWDGQDIARDYYVVTNGQGMKLWVYRERRPPKSWYLHGVFA